MEKTEKNTIKETKENEIVELKDDDLATVPAGKVTMTFVIGGKTYQATPPTIDPSDLH